MSTRGSIIYPLIVLLMIMFALVGNDFQINKRLFTADFFFMGIEGSKIVTHFLLNAFYEMEEWQVYAYQYSDTLKETFKQHLLDSEKQTYMTIHDVTASNMMEYAHEKVTSHQFWFSLMLLLNSIAAFGPSLSWMAGMLLKFKFIYSEATAVKYVYYVFRVIVLFVDIMKPRIQLVHYNKDWRNGRVGLGMYAGTAYFEPIGDVYSTCSYGMPIKMNFTESAKMTMKDPATGKTINLRQMVENGKLPCGYDQRCEQKYKNVQCYSTIAYDVCNVASGCFHDALRCLCGRILCERKYKIIQTIMADFQMLVSLDLDYLAGRDMHILTYETTQWIDNMTGKSRRDHLRELDRHSFMHSDDKNFIRKQTRASCFIKIESLLSKNKICHIPEYRAVQASTKYANVVFGPTIKAVGSWLGINWNMKTALAQGTQSLMTYASGMQASDVGNWFGDALALVDDAVVVIVDFHRWDKNSSGPLNLPFEELLKKLCDKRTLTDEFWQYYRPQVNGTDGVVSGKGIFYSVDEGQVKSGFPYTSCKNTYIQGLATLYGILKSLQLAGHTKFANFHDLEGLLYAIALGDDNLIVLPRWMAKAVSEHFDDVLHGLGTDPEMAIKSVADAEFCSSTFTPCVDKDGKERYLLTPFPTKMLSKTMFIRRDVGIRKQRGHARNIAINLMPRFNHIPFMRTYFANARRYAEMNGYKDWTDPKWLRADAWNFKNMEPMYCSDKTYQWFTERYGVTKTEMLDLEKYMLAMPDKICTLAHPVLAQMFEVDCHVLLTQHDIETGYMEGNFVKTM